MKLTRLLLLLPAIAGIVFLVSSFTASHCACGGTPQRHLGSISAATPMLAARSGHTATLLPDGRVLIAGGMRRNQELYRSAELYDSLTGKFSPAGEMNVARVGHVAVLLSSGKVLIAGGWVGQGATDSAELYDPKTGKFTAIAPMSARRGRPSATLLENGDVLIAGGADHDTPGGVTSAEVFHVLTACFQPVGSMHYARIAHTSTLLKDGRVLIAGGRGQRVNAASELYDPKTKRFVETGSLQQGRYKHTAGLLPDGRVLVAGGSDERDWNGMLHSAEIYNPVTGKFSAAGDMHDSRFKLPDEAIQLEAGRLLIGGGSEHSEIYDPRGGDFLLVPGFMDKPWHFMTETRLQDGRVLLAGGYANDPEATAQTWIYRP